MHRRPRLKEALAVLTKLSSTQEDAAQALADYKTLLSSGEEFQASRMVVDIVDHYYHLLDLKGIVHV